MNPGILDIYQALYQLSYLALGTECGFSNMTDCLSNRDFCSNDICAVMMSELKIEDNRERTIEFPIEMDNGLMVPS